jgi:hypothetical protein
MVCAMKHLVPLLLIATPALAADPPAPPATTAAPETRTCIDNRDIRSSRFSRTGGYYVQTRNGWWRNAAGQCGLIRPDSIIVTQSTQNRQCRGDIVQVMDRLTRFTVGACGLSDWEKVDGPPKDAR